MKRTSLFTAHETTKSSSTQFLAKSKCSILFVIDGSKLFYRTQHFLRNQFYLIENDFWLISRQHSYFQDQKLPLNVTNENFKTHEKQIMWF